MVFRRYGTLTAATVPLTDGQGKFTHLKSDLIDLESRQADWAQAEVEILLAA